MSTNIPTMNLGEAREKPAIQVVDFYTEYEPDPNKPGENRAVDYVKWVKIGDASGMSNTERVDMLRPRTRPAKAYRNHLGQARFTSPKSLQAAPEWEVVEPHYNAWKQGEKLPDTGTLLIAWPGCDRRLADALKKVNILTLEEFVQAGNIIERVPMPGIQRLQKEAENFLLAQGDVARTSAALSERDQRISAQDETIANITREMEALRTLVQAGAAKKDDEEPKPSPDMMAAIADYEITWGGPSHKHRVMKGDEVVKHGFESREDAADWLASHLQPEAA